MVAKKVNILTSLATGDMRTTGSSDREVEAVLKNPGLVSELFEGLIAEHPGLRMRCADVLAKVAAKKPELLMPFKRELIQEIARIDQQEVQWHVAEILWYLDLSAAEARQAEEILVGYFDHSKSRIVRVNALQALVVLSRKHPSLLLAADDRLARALNSGIPSLAARARKMSTP